MAAPATMKVPVSYKVDVGTRKGVDLLSSALGVEKSAVIQRAVRALTEQHADELHRYIDEATAAVEQGGDWAIAERLTATKRDMKYRGGRPRRRGQKE